MVSTLMALAVAAHKILELSLKLVHDISHSWRTCLHFNVNLQVLLDAGF